MQMELRKFKAFTMHWSIRDSMWRYATVPLSTAAFSSQLQVADTSFEMNSQQFPPATAV